MISAPWGRSVGPMFTQRSGSIGHQVWPSVEAAISQFAFPLIGITTEETKRRCNRSSMISALSPSTQFTVVG